jgi:hypothetical protein
VPLPERASEISREQPRTSLKLPTDPKEFIAILATELDGAYQRTLDGLRREHPIFELAEGRIDLERLDALNEPASLKALRARIGAMLPDVDLPELLLEVATGARFTTAFTHEREPSARLSDWTLKPDPARVTRPVVRTLLAAGQVTVTLERRAAADQPSTTCSVRARRGAR